MAFSTIGDSFSIIATLGGIAVTSWSFNVACGLLFPDKVESARNAVSTRSSAVIGKGFLALLFGVLSFIVISLPNPLTKLLGTLMLASYFGLVAVGISGIAKLAAERMQSLKDGQSNLFDSFAKASMYIVLAAMLPILGWFLFAPMLILFGGGAGLIAILKPVHSKEVA
jgi:hypothetical protein